MLCGGLECPSALFLDCVDKQGIANLNQALRKPLL